MFLLYYHFPIEDSSKSFETKTVHDKTIKLIYRCSRLSENNLTAQDKDNIIILEIAPNF